MVQHFCRMVLASSLLIVGFSLPRLTDSAPHSDAAEMTADGVIDGYSSRDRAPDHTNDYHHETLEIPEGVSVPAVRRLYSSWSHLLDLEPGEHEIRVTLNANGHEQLTYHGEAIADSVIIEVSEPESTAQ